MKNLSQQNTWSTKKICSFIIPHDEDEKWEQRYALVLPFVTNYMSSSSSGMVFVFDVWFFLKHRKPKQPYLFHVVLSFTSDFSEDIFS